jgi:large subunit ribosomal protein L25
MSAIFELNAKARHAKGKGASRRLRKEELVPGIVYGAGKPAESVTFMHGDLLKALQHEAFYSHILTLHIDGKPEKAVVKDIQRHPFKPKIVHMDFLRIDATHKINMHVPLHFHGEEDAPGVAVAKGHLTKYIMDIEIRCLPANLPEFITADVSKLGLDESLHLTQLALPEGVEFAHKIEDEAHDPVIASIHMPRGSAEDEAEEAAAEAAEEAAETAAEGEASETTKAD